MIALLRKALTACPFEPITVFTSDGANVTIKNSEFAAVLRKAGVLYVESPEEKEPRFIGLRSIKEVRAKLDAPYDLEQEPASED